MKITIEIKELKRSKRENIFNNLDKQFKKLRKNDFDPYLTIQSSKECVCV